MATISAVIPARNASRTIAACLDALTASGRYEQVLVVDDASTDETARLAAEAGAEVVCCRSRVGPARARNLGASRASGEVVLFVDSDVLVPPGTGERLRADFADPDVAAVQSLYAPDCPARDIVSRYQNFYYHFSFARLQLRRIAVFATWCAAIRRDAFQAAGGFNERIPDPTVEDEELGYALADAGCSILLDKGLQVVHLARYGLAAFARRRFRMARAQAKSAWRSIRKRLLLRYVNIRATGTHHSRLVVLGILSLLAGQAALLLSLFPFGGTAFPCVLRTVSALSIPACLATNSPFLRKSVNSLGIKLLPAFLVLCLFDMLVLGWGIVIGSIEYATGSRY